VRSMLVAFKMMSLEEVISSVMRVFSEYCKEIVRHDGHNSLLSTAYVLQVLSFTKIY